MFLFPLFKRFKKGIIFALTLVVIENVAWIVEPTLFGKVIDAVIDVQVQKYNTDSLSSLQMNNILAEKNLHSHKDTGKINNKNLKDSEIESDLLAGGTFPLIQDTSAINLIYPRRLANR